MINPDWTGFDDMSPAQIAALSAEARAEHYQHRCEALVTPPPEYIDMLACLSRQQRCIVGRLLKSAGQIVPHAALITAAEAAGRGVFTADDVVKTQLSKARQRMAAAGIPIKIENIWGVGYRASLPLRIKAPRT